jgi:hypothetical protein
MRWHVHQLSVRCRLRTRLPGRHLKDRKTCFDVGTLAVVHRPILCQLKTFEVVERVRSAQMELPQDTGQPCTTSAHVWQPPRLSIRHKVGERMRGHPLLGHIKSSEASVCGRLRQLVPPVEGYAYSIRRRSGRLKCLVAAHQPSSSSHSTAHSSISHRKAGVSSRLLGCHQMTRALAARSDGEGGDRCVRFCWALTNLPRWNCRTASNRRMVMRTPVSYCTCS